MRYVIFIIIATIAISLLYFIFRKNKTGITLTDEFKDILNLLNNTNESIYITGKAGTGKSILLKHFRNTTNKNLVVLAPTGVAALNVGGQTIHSFFHFRPEIINQDLIEPDYVRADIFNELQTIIIDEVSMVRADLMNGIDVALRKNRNRPNDPFGGVQMVFIGDLFQLPPVLTEKDREKIFTMFGGQYFFDAPVFKEYIYHFKELTRVFRQSEKEVEFKNLLNNIRNKSMKHEDMVLLNSRHRDNTTEHDDSIFLTTKKTLARKINIEQLERLKGEEFLYLGKLSKKYVTILKKYGEEKLEEGLPAPYKLKLKKNAHIMMLKNDPDKRWVNGSMGNIHKLDSDQIWVNINGRIHKVEKESWKEVEPILNKKNKKFEEKVSAEFHQYPIGLGYAITIHKSQGKTFEKITVDVGRGAFAHGQVYVALSRCKTLAGIVLNNPIGKKDIIVDPRVIEYHASK